MPKTIIGAAIGAGLALVWLRFGFFATLFVGLAALAGWAVERYLWPRRAELLAALQTGPINRRREVK